MASGVIIVKYPKLFWQVFGAMATPPLRVCTLELQVWFQRAKPVISTLNLQELGHCHIQGKCTSTSQKILDGQNFCESSL